MKKDMTKPNDITLAVINTNLIGKFFPFAYFMMISVFARVNAIALKKFKVFNSIIKFISVFMVNNLFWIKKSLKMFFHNQPMFFNISLASYIRMIRTPDFNISLTIYSPSTSKMSSFNLSRTIYGAISLVYMFIRGKHFQTHWAFLLNISKICSTLSRTKTSMIRWEIKKLFFTVFTDDFNHLYLYYTQRY